MEIIRIYERMGNTYRVISNIVSLQILEHLTSGDLTDEVKAANDTQKQQHKLTRKIRSHQCKEPSEESVSNV